MYYDYLNDFSSLIVHNIYNANCTETADEFSHTSNGLTS